MDDTVLKALLDGLDTCRGSLNAWLTTWTWMVVIGVALELVFAFHEHFDDLSLWKPGIVRAPAKPSIGWFIFELFAIALVTVGIIGELKVEANLGSLETQIRDVNGRRLLLLQQEAGDARNSATAAADAAGRAEAIANRVSDRASVLEHDEKDVKTDLLLKGSRAELLGKPEVFLKLKAALKTIAGQKVDVRYPSDKEEGEPLQAAEMLSLIMQQAGVAATRPMLAKTGAITGVVVLVTMRASDTTKANALVLANALLEVPLILRRNRSIPNPPPFGDTYDSVIAREPQKFRPGVEPPPFDDQTIVVLVAPHP